MTEKKYIYVIEAYGYSDFEKTILSHKTLMSDKMFFDIVKKAQKLCETTDYIPDKFYKDYAANMIACLCKVFGFEELDYPSVHIGVSPKSKCFMWTENGAYEK